MSLKKHFNLTAISLLSIVIVCNAQVAPVVSPTGGFNIDGYLERQGSAGDWLKGNSTLDAPGSFVFSSSGIPLLPNSFRFVDLWNSNDDNVFFKAGFNENPNTFKWQFKKANAVKDINNSLVYLTKDALNHAWAIATADRYRNNSDVFLEFEFLQNPVLATIDPPGKNGQPSRTGGFVSYGPHGGRTVGDVLITLDFTGGGRNAAVYIYVWKDDPSGGYNYQESFFAPAMAAENNSASINVPFGAFGSTTYPVNTFAEVALDMTAAAGRFSCLTGENTYRTIWIKSKTRTGNGFTYDDFVTPIQLNISNEYSLTATVDFFDLISAQLTAAVSPGEINDYNFHWNAVGADINDVIDPAITGTLNNYNIYNPIFTADPDHYCTPYLYEVTIERKDNPGCIVARTPVVINSPCKIGKPINPDKPNLTQDLMSEVNNNSKRIMVYPNPSKGTATITLPASGNARDIELIDMKGAVIQKWTSTLNNTVQFKQLSSGLYLVRVTTKNTGEVATKKIIINR